MKQFFVYILASKRNGTLYVGVTNDLKRRVYEHKHHVVEGFTKKYNVSLLVYYEIFENSEEAIFREKRMKRWKREWKVKRIESKNPLWKDLYEEV